MFRVIDLSQLIEPFTENPYQQQNMNARTTISPHNTFELTGWLDCQLHLSDHCGTHFDATLHLNPEGRATHEVPVDALFGEAVMVDFTHKKAREDIAAREIEASLRKLGEDPRGVRILLVKTGRDKLYGTPEYHTDFPNITVDAHRWLLDRGLRVIGVDSACTEIDRKVENPALTRVEERYPAHCLMREYEYYILENLAHLDQVPVHRFLFAAFPLKLKGASGSPVRAVALLQDR